MLKVLGKVPTSRFVSRNADIISVNDPILLGIVPVRLLVPRLKYVNDVNNPMLLGIVPDRLLAAIVKWVNDVNDPTLLGIVPVNDRLSNIICVTLAYVADPLVESHVTP